MLKNPNSVGEHLGTVREVSGSAFPDLMMCTLEIFAVLSRAARKRIQQDTIVFGCLSREMTECDCMPLPADKGGVCKSEWRPEAISSVYRTPEVCLCFYTRNESTGEHAQCLPSELYNADSNFLFLQGSAGIWQFRPKGTHSTFPPALCGCTGWRAY